jgi:tight adherence protein B
MTMVLLTFIVAFAVVLLVYWLLVVRPESAEQATLRKRLKQVSVAKPQHNTQLSVVKAEERLSAVALLDRLLTGLAFLTAPVKKRIKAAGLQITVGTLLLACAIAGLGTFVVVGAFLHLGWIGMVAGIGAAYVPFAVVGFKAKKRLLAFEEQFPDAIDLIGRALRAGHAFPTGLSMVADEADQPVSGEFRQLYEHQNFGMPLPDAMRLFAERVPVLDARFFVTAVLTQRESGGNLSEILDNLAGVVRERFRVKRQIRVVSAHGRMTGWVLSLLPPGLAVMFMIVSPSHLKTMVNDPLGVQMILGAVVMQVIGTVIIRKLVNIEY